VNAILAAVIHRMKTDRGQFIELSMFEAMVSFVMSEHMSGLTYDPPAGASGYSRIMNPWRRPYATKDGYLSVLPYTTAQWRRFFTLIGRDDLAEDPELANPVQRNARVSELYTLIAEAMPRRTSKAWVADLLSADILFGEVLSPEELITDPHLEATGLFAMVDHPTEGRIRLINPPVRSSERIARMSRLPPTLGQHSVEILREILVDTDRIDDLVRRGLVIDFSEQAASRSQAKDS
jgi:crotonobetainyl-CoA:carnitine CoA-transferase CaiB-like acyl-CoA transferase